VERQNIENEGKSQAGRAKIVRGKSINAVSGNSVTKTVGLANNCMGGQV